MSAGLLMGNAVMVGVFTATVDLASTPAAAASAGTAVTSVTINGIKVGDVVFCNKPSHETGLGIVNVRVSAANTVEITTMNCTSGGAINEASETFTFLVVRPEAVTSSFPAA